MTKLSPNCQACGQPIENDTARQAYARFEQQKQAFENKTRAALEAEFQAKQASALATARHEGAAAAQAQYQALEASVEERIATAIAGEQAARIEEREKLLRKNTELSRQLQDLSTAERKRLAQDYLRETLQAAFPNDIVSEIRSGANGADVLQTVIDDGKECGKILWESKDTAKHEKAHVTKLEKDRDREGADLGVLCTSAMPPNTLCVHMVDEIYITQPENIIQVGVTLRQELIRRAGAPDLDVDIDHAELFKYMLTDGQEHMDAWRELNGKSRELTQAMKDAHKRLENARERHDAAQEAAYYEFQQELDTKTGRNTGDRDDE